MTIEERIDMYQHKKLFIDGISKVFEIEALQSNVKKIEYEVYSKQFNEDTFYTEFIVITLGSGTKSMRTVSGTSVNGIFREIGRLIDGGYYDELKYYKSVVESSTKVNLEG